ncbi:MAG: MFS transporter [Bacillota bacterium]
MENIKKMATKSEVFRYAFGGLGSNIPFMLILTYLMFFYTEVEGISPALVGTLFFITRFIDAVTDPLMGMIADRTRSKFGKYRPWLIFGAPLLGLSTVSLFWVPDLADGPKIAYIFTTYILYSLISTVVNIPYHSLTPTISEDPNQRTWIATAKQFMGIPANMLAQVIFLPLVGLFGGGEQGYLYAAIIYGVVIVVSFWTCASSAKRHDIVEVVDSKLNTAPKVKMKDQLSLIGKNTPLLMLMIAMSTNLIATAIQSSVALYFWTYNVERPELFPILSLVGLLLSIPLFFMMPSLSKKIEKKGVFLYGSIASIIPFIVLLVVPAEVVWVSFTAAVLVNILAPFTGAIAWAMLPDCVEYGEWKTGIKGAGVVSSSLTFVNKLGSAVGGILGGALLAAAGYVAGQAQTPEALQMIVYLYAIFPILGHVATIIALKFYKLDSNLYNKILEELQQRKKFQSEEKISS